MNRTINEKLLAYIRCPACGAEPVPAGSSLHCDRCDKKYDVVDGIPVLMGFEKPDAHLAGQVKYFNKESESRSAYMLQAWQKSYLERFAENFKPREGDLLVDCGTGSGYMAVELAGLGCECIACDLSLESLRWLNQELKDRELDTRVHLVCCNAEELPLKTGIAKYIISNAVLEHLPAPGKAVAEISRVSQDQAGLMAAAPLAYRHLNPVFIPLNMIHDRRIGHLRRYDEKSLSEAFAGWELAKTYYTGHYAKVAKTLSNTVMPRFSEDRIEAGDRLKETKRWGASNIICMFRRE